MPAQGERDVGLKKDWTYSTGKKLCKLGFSVASRLSSSFPAS